MEFFACLDQQLNKVNQFFRTKEKEFLERGDSLKNQLEILIELKTALKQKQFQGPSCRESKEDVSVSGTISCELTESEQGMENSTDEAASEARKPCRLKKEDRKIRNLNMLAFAKILKKFDRVTNKGVLPIYLKVVESSYFNSSDKVIKLADEVEEIFLKHFAEDDKRKAMKYLKPTQRKESHSVSFFIVQLELLR